MLKNFFRYKVHFLLPNIVDIVYVPMVQAFVSSHFLLALLSILCAAVQDVAVI